MNAASEELWHEAVELITELFFVILPLLVILVNRSLQPVPCRPGDHEKPCTASVNADTANEPLQRPRNDNEITSEFLHETEISFAAAVFFGQAIVKCLILALRRRLRPATALLITTAIVVVGLAPALVILGWMMNGGNNVFDRTVYAQLVWFILSLLTYAAIAVAAVRATRRAAHIAEHVESSS